MDSIPDEYKCPIGMDLMTDPVIGSDGHTYERSNIEHWLQSNSDSPMTRQSMALADLKPNFALRSAIERWKLGAPHSHAPIVQETQPQPQSPLEKTFFVRIVKSETDGDASLELECNSMAPMETALIAVLDTSGSMDSLAQSQSAVAASEQAPFSRLDLVKHSMRTLSALMHSQYATTKSSLGIIQFNTKATILMPVKQMDALGYAEAKLAITNLSASGSTNIWDGLRLALDQASLILNRNPSTNVQILLLTDGEPTQDAIPPMGIMPTVKRKLAQIGSKVTISGFGFGYNLDRGLMESVCVEGGGSFGFIPDCSMVGTVFINWCAKALLTVAHNVRVQVGEETFFIGDCLKGQSKSMYFPIWKDDMKIEGVQYDNGLFYTPIPIEQFGSTLQAKYISKLYDTVKALTHIQGIPHVERLGQSHHQQDTDNDPMWNLTRLYTELSSLKSQDPLIQDMLLDIMSSNESEGQIQKAVSKQEWWSTWGANHCIAYARALRLQQCINFKDKVLQHFASDDFKELQEKGADIFSTLEPPTPSAYTAGNLTFSSGPINMSQYMYQAGPCFAGDCFVRMHDNTYCKVRNLRKGDLVYGGHAVACLLFTSAHYAKIEMVHFESGLQITQWHPMRQEGLPWMFPAEHPAGKLKKEPMDGYYNLVLESGHIVEMHGYEVCTLGHGFTENDVIAHPYFGTESVIKDLKTYSGWDYGFVMMDPFRLIRSSETGLVIRI
jgi:Mg-chelatase subunit ChlD